MGRFSLFVLVIILYFSDIGLVDRNMDFRFFYSQHQLDLSPLGEVMVSKVFVVITQYFANYLKVGERLSNALCTSCIVPCGVIACL